MDDVLTQLRTLLLTFNAVTALVSGRIRPDAADSADGASDVIILELPDADQANCMTGEGIVNGDLIIRTRSTNKTTAAMIAEAVRVNNGTNGLDGFMGTAGTGHIIECERTEFSQYQVEDDDEDNDSFFETESLYSLWYQIS